MKKGSNKQRLISRLAQAILAMVGVSSMTSCFMAMYGCPTQDYTVKGTVTDEEGKPIKGIQVMVNHNRDTLYTDANGKWCSKLYEGGDPWGEMVVFSDVDGPLNGGRFMTSCADVSEMESHQLKKGHGWYEGEFEYTDYRHLTHVQSDTLDLERIAEQVIGREWTNEDDKLLYTLRFFCSEEEEEQYCMLYKAWQEAVQADSTASIASYPAKWLEGAAWEALHSFVMEHGSRCYALTVLELPRYEGADRLLPGIAMVNLILPEHQAIVDMVSEQLDATQPVNEQPTADSNLIRIAKALIRIGFAMTSLD